MTAMPDIKECDSIRPVFNRTESPASADGFPAKLPPSVIFRQLKDVWAMRFAHVIKDGKLYPSVRVGSSRRPFGDIEWVTLDDVEAAIQALRLALNAMPVATRDGWGQNGATEAETRIRSHFSVHEMLVHDWCLSRGIRDAIVQKTGPLDGSLPESLEILYQEGPGYP